MVKNSLLQFNVGVGQGEELSPLLCLFLSMIYQSLFHKLSRD